jgi:hypothetical protein
MNENYNIKQNYDGTYSVNDLYNHSLSTFRDIREAKRYIEDLLHILEEPIVKSPEEIKRAERKEKLKKLFNFE